MAGLNDFNSYPFPLFKDPSTQKTMKSWLQNPADPRGFEGREFFCYPDKRVPLDWSRGNLYDPLGHAFLDLMERDLGGHADRFAPMPFMWIITSLDYRSAQVLSGQVWVNGMGRSGDTPLISIQFEMANYKSLGFSVPNRELVKPIRTSQAFNWQALNDEDFERLLFRLYSELKDFDNVQWMQKTRAADSGRDISADRISTGDRVLIQARHQQSSLNAPSVSDLVVKAETWHPPFQGVIVATTSAFTQEAVRWTENHNVSQTQRPKVTLEPAGHLEVLLSRHPELTAHLGLR